MIRLNLLFYFFIVSVFLNFFIMKWVHKLSPNSKKQIQNIHLGEVSRLGGLVIFTIFSIYTVFFNNDYLIFGFLVF